VGDQRRTRHPPAEERFWAKVDKNGPVVKSELGPCWLWTAGTTDGGYGKFNPTARRTVLAHRFSYELEIGPIPDGLTLDHLCRNRPCVRASHLEPTTQRVNILRGEGVAAINAAKTHCDNGHEFTEANTRYTSTQRVCRICARETVRRWQVRQNGT
jgi:hypothetical protein